MNIRTRLILGFMLVVGLGFWYVSDWIIKEIRPHYLKAMEESLVDISTVLAAYASEDFKDGTLDTAALRTIFESAKSRHLSAQIYEYEKQSLALRVYVTDTAGIVLFDSDTPSAVGQNYRQWRDVSLTLNGQYGARSTRRDENDPASGIQYSGAPIVVDGSIVGVLTAAKPKESAVPFIRPAKLRFVYMAVSALGAMALIGILITIWITNPIQKLIAYVRKIRRGVHVPVPNLHTVGILGRHELDELEEAIVFMQENLQKKQYVEQYVQTLTHEIKSPLAAIRGAAELIDESMPADDLNRFAGNIRSESLRIQEMVDRMLELSAIEVRTAADRSECINLRSFLEEIVESQKGAMGEKNLTLTIAVPDELSMHAERFLMRQAVDNLVRNAIAFSAENGSIELTAKADNGVVFTVDDHGSGIPEYAVDKIFDRFYSLSRPDTQKRSSGIGLSFVREAVELHGGSVTVANREDGSGVRARVVIPG